MEKKAVNIIPLDDQAVAVKQLLPIDDKITEENYSRKAYDKTESKYDDDTC